MAETHRGLRRGEERFVALVTAALAAAASASLFYATPFFRDFAAVLEGGQRIALGQLPYRDFSLPFGPLTLYMQAGFQLLLGDNATALMAHGAVLAGLLALAGYVVFHRHFGSLPSMLLGLFLALSLNGASGNPWFANTAYFFLACTGLLLFCWLEAPRLPMPVLLAAALMSVLAIFAKQDVVWVVPLLALYFAASGAATPARVALGYLLPVVVLVVAVALSFQIDGAFVYWFDFGQPPHALLFGRFDVWLAGLPWDARFWLLVLLAVYLAGRRPPAGPRRSAVLLAMLLAAVALSILPAPGHAAQAAMQGWPLIAALLLYDAAPARRLPVVAGMIVALVVLVSPLPLARSVAANAAIEFARPGWSALGRSHVRLESGSLQGVLVERRFAAEIGRIRQQLKLAGGSFVNMSELHFLYADTGVPPPERLPLWFRYGTTFFAADVAFLTVGVANELPGAVLVQDAYGHGDPGMQARLVDFFATHGYHRVLSIPGATRGARIEVFLQGLGGDGPRRRRGG